MTMKRHKVTTKTVKVKCKTTTKRHKIATETQNGQIADNDVLHVFLFQHNNTNEDVFSLSHSYFDVKEPDFPPDQMMLMPYCPLHGWG